MVRPLDLKSGLDLQGALQGSEPTSTDVDRRGRGEMFPEEEKVLEPRASETFRPERSMLVYNCSQSVSVPENYLATKRTSLVFAGTC